MDGCVATQINPTTLIAGGAVLKYGTKNVMIQCNCTDNGHVINDVKWHNPDGIRLVDPASPHFNSSVPHVTTVNKYDKSNVILVIPTFTYYYAGIYTCGRRVYPLGTPNTTINLTLLGELISRC